MPRSAQDFIRALKAPTDPPQPGGPSKLAVARDAWDDPTFYVPNKDEAVAEWLLGRLLKDRATALDAEHWTLLRDVLSSPRNTTSRPLKTWLLPLLHRTPLAPIVVSVYQHLAKSDADFAVVHPFSECVSILWPSATIKYNTETLLECFSAVLHFFGTRQQTEHNAKEDRWLRFLRLSQQIVASYRMSVTNSSNKKKIFSGFMQNHMADWIQCVAPENETSPYCRLYSDVYEAGLETLFNADALRQTQDREDALYPRIFSQLLIGHPAALCKTLPRLFQAFVHSTRKHRASIFGQSSHQAPGSSAEQARLAALRFFAMCESVLSGTTATEPVLRARINLLELVDAESLYGVNNEPVEDILRRSGDDAISMLATKKEDPHPYYALSILSKITRIDYDLLSQHVPSVLPHLFTVSPSIHPAFEYLELILDYHSKTRTLDVLVDALLKACRAESWLANRSDRRTAYRSAASSTVFQQRYLGNLSRLVNSFLTPGQILISAELITRQLSETLSGCNGGPSLGDSGEKRPRKRRKSEKGESLGDPVQSEAEVVAFALQSRIAATVLSALPTRFLEDDVRATVESTVQEFYSSLRPVIKDTLKHSRGEGDGNWASHLLVSSALRLKYVLRTASALHLSSDGDEKLSPKLLSSTKSATLLPELRVEVFRVLLADVDLGYCSAEPVYEAILDFVEASQTSSGAIWAGATHNMDSEAETGIALMHVLLERWLPQFDTHASGKQLQRLAKLITSPHLQKTLTRSSSPREGLDVPMILQRSLHNAELWELPRLRDSLLEQIDVQTQTLSEIDVDKTLVSLKKSKRKSQRSEVSPLVAATYSLLLYIPMEYLTRAIRTDLMRRAVAADIALAATGTSSDALETSLVLREYLRRAYTHAGQVEPTIAGSYLLFLLRHTPTLGTCSDAFVQTTLELIEMHLLSGFKAAAKGDLSTLTEVINYLSETTHDAVDLLRARCLILLIDLLAPEHKASAIDRSIFELFMTLQRQYLGLLEPKVAALSFVSESHEADQSEVLMLRLWDHLLVFQTWLGLDAGQVPHLGGLLVSKLLSSNKRGKRSNAYVATLSIIQQECRMELAGETKQQLEMVIGSYLAFCPACEPKERRDMDELVGKFARRLSLEHFADLLDLALNGLSEPGLGLRELVDLVAAATLLLHNAPEGSSKVTQAHFSSCLQLFAGRPQFLQDPELQEKSLHFVASQLTNRPAAVRQQDLSSIWSILSTSLEGSANHDISTHRATFNEIISILSALIRLRRDLVTSTLPHLGHVLRRLLQSLRHIRPNLGAKQTKLVTDTLPRWTNTSTPLVAEEAKAVARLLTTMTTKTLVRGQSAGDSDKAESLARPFSKHAAYVLAAYVEAMNDPLCALPQDTRRELEPGLFALCDMMGEYNRDAMMVASLDAPGKVVMKGIWREYEKQKYVGKG